jgi:hypothetical protein
MKTTLSNSINLNPVTGRNDVNFDLVSKHFDKHTYIQCYTTLKGDKGYRLIQTTPKGRAIKVKEDINKHDAGEIIFRLSLNKVKVFTDQIHHYVLP